MGQHYRVSDKLIAVVELFGATCISKPSPGRQADRSRDFYGESVTDQHWGGVGVNEPLLVTRIHSNFQAGL